MGDQLDQGAGARVDQADDDPRRHHEGDDDERVVHKLLAGRPGDLLELMVHHFEAVRDFQPQILEKAPDLRVSLWLVCFLQKRQYLFISRRSGSFFLFLMVL